MIAITYYHIYRIPGIVTFIFVCAYQRACLRKSRNLFWVKIELNVDVGLVNTMMLYNVI